MMVGSVYPEIKIGCFGFFRLLKMKYYQDETSSKMGMWLFLSSEILLFGGLFILYSVYRFKFSHSFHLAAEALNRPIGTVNTLLLLTSSLTMALSISSLKEGKRSLSLFSLIATLLLGLLFLGLKYVEWVEKIDHGIYPNSPRLLERNSGEILFFGLYYSMIGLHGFHVLIGLIVLVIMGILIIKGKVNEDHFIPLENMGLYWHLVDILWVLLFPLFYLIP